MTPEDEVYKHRCPRCGHVGHIEQTTVGRLLAAPSSLDLANRGTCLRCQYQAPVGFFDLMQRYAHALDLCDALDPCVIEPKEGGE